MKVTDERLLESMKTKDVIRDMLINNPMSYAEIQQAMNIPRNKLTNHMTQLKKFGFVKYCDQDANKHITMKRYIAVIESGTYSQMMSDRRAINSQMTWKDGIEKFSNKASMKVTCEDYHTKGNRSKVNAWSGYASMGSL